VTGPVYAYGAFGVRVLCNRRLPALAPVSADASRTVHIEIAEECVIELRAPTSRPALATGYESLWRMRDGGWVLRYGAVESAQAWMMRLENGGGRIEVSWTRSVPMDDLLQIVQTIGLASALQLAGGVVLHGCVIELGGQAIIVLGPSGAGKSTTSAAFVVAGHALLSDDIAAIEVVDEEPIVHPGLTQLRVTPTTAHALGWDPQRLPLVFGSEMLGDKRRVQLSQATGSFCAQARRIAGIYVLHARDSIEPGAPPEVAALKPRDAVPVLLANCYRISVLDHVQRGQLLGSLARVAQDVPVWRVRAADDLAALPLLLKALT